MATNVSEKEARDVAEAAREAEWKLPSFGKELFLGDFRLDLIHPQPKLDPEPIEKGERFLAELRDVPRSRGRPARRSSATRRSPTTWSTALKRIGALGMKVPPEYGGLGLSQVYYNRALALAGTWHSSICTLLSAHQSIGVAEPLRMFGSEEQKQKWLPLVAKDHISRVPAHRARRRLRPGAHGLDATPADRRPTDGTGYRINGRKLWATNGAIADIVVVMAKVPEERGPPRRHQRLRAAVRQRGRSRSSTATQFMGLRGIENSVTRPRRTSSCPRRT